MSFYSREFQSYGYGERLARLFRPNFWMAATKPDKKDKKEEDTAYWNARVLTDADGRATRFVPPAREPDDVERVGRCRGHARPLRRGHGRVRHERESDILRRRARRSCARETRAQVRLLVSNQDKAVRDVKATLEVPDGVTSAAPPAVSAKLAPKAEASGRGTMALKPPTRPAPSP